MVVSHSVLVPNLMRNAPLAAAPRFVVVSHPIFIQGRYRLSSEAPVLEILLVDGHGPGQKIAPLTISGVSPDYLGTISGLAWRCLVSLGTLFDHPPHDGRR